jgi:hypothetical protein
MIGLFGPRSPSAIEITAQNLFRAKTKISRVGYILQVELTASKKYISNEETFQNLNLAFTD